MVVATATAGEDAKKLDHSDIAGGTSNGTAALENSWAVSQQTKYLITIWASYHTLGHLSESNANLCSYKT